MSRRIEIELTSSRDDGSWTWRAAGAREPRGTVENAILPGGSKVGDVLRVEIDGYLDGVSVVAVVPPRAERTEPERLEEWFANDVELDAVPGGEGVFEWDNGEVRHAIVESVEELQAVGEEIGYPLLIKAAAGGGGKGMEVVESPGEAERAFETARRQGQSYFANPDVYVEKLIVDPRHVEVQVLADAPGNVYVVGAKGDPRRHLIHTLRALRDAGLRVTAANHEFYGGQFEINLDHSGALDAADRAFRCKSAVPEVAGPDGAPGHRIAERRWTQGGSPDRSARVGRVPRWVGDRDDGATVWRHHRG